MSAIPKLTTSGGANERLSVFGYKSNCRGWQYPFSLGQLRHYLIMRHKNNLEIAVRKIGKRLYLRKDLFEQWIEDQKERKNG